MIKVIIAIILVFSVLANLTAQESDSLKTRPAQVTFAYPIGSSGMSSFKYSNNFSFNILYGLNGGVNGVEIGSLLNYNKGQVKGFQLSGVSNINRAYSKGILLAGISNIITDSSAGLMVSGVINYTKKNSKGFQLSTLNISANEFRGFQMGVVNYAKKINGVQFGLINILSDGEKGIPMGLVSIVKNGHYEFEITAGEVMYSNLVYKMGVERFYTIYKTSYASYKNTPVYSVGLGFGRNILLSEKQKISVDLTTNQIFYNNDWEGNLNMLNKVDFNYKYNISQKFSFLIGPSFNIYLTKKMIDGEYGTLNIPYSINSNQWASGKLWMWFGLNAGLSLKL